MIYFNNTVLSLVKITSIINEINFNFNYMWEGVVTGGLTLPLVAMSFGGHFSQPVPIATHWQIGSVVVPYQRMRGNRHGMAKKAAKTDLSWRDCCFMVRAAAACFVVVLCYHSCRVRYTNNTPTLWSFSPKYGSYPLTPTQCLRSLFTWGAGVRAKLSYFGEKLGVFSFHSTSIFSLTW